MSTRRAKQLIYGAFYAILWILFFWGIYAIFIRPSASNPVACQGTGCTPTSAGPIVVEGLVNSFVTSPGHYTFLAEVANPNANQAAQSFDYAFNLYDASNTLIASFPGQSFLYPSEIKYLVLPNEILSSPVARAEFTVKNPVWMSSTEKVPQFSFPNLQTASASTTVAVNGKIVNSDVFSFAPVTIVAIFKDSNGNPVGASQTQVDSLAPGAAANFSIMYPALPNVSPSNYQVFAYGVKG